MREGDGRGDQARAGLQRERTVLAWNRTAVAMVLVGVLFASFARRDLLGTSGVPALLALVTGLWMTWVTHARPGGLEWQEAHNRLRLKRTLTVAVVTTVLGVSGLVLVLASIVTG